jgi:Fe-Mn family superoxide dismutase
MHPLTRRQLLRSAAAGAAAWAAAPLAAWAEDKPKAAAGFTLPPLPYPPDALEPSIDKMTMEIHHGKHHKAYVDNLNKALADSPELLSMPVEAILSNLSQVPEKARVAVKNNGGGHANHTLFWEIMSPVKDHHEPSGELAAAIKSTFTDLPGLQKVLKEKGLGQFGSGWAWLVVGDGKLDVIQSANQDSPYLIKKTPILGIDVWEHAYYLKYQNRRADYIDAWFKVVNWGNVGKRFAAAMQKT